MRYPTLKTYDGNIILNIRKLNNKGNVMIFISGALGGGVGGQYLTFC